jgi:hypothetical protein
MDEQEFLYPTNVKAETVLKDPRRGGRVPVEPQRVVRDVLDFDGDAHTDWMLNSSFRLMREGDLVWFYAAGYGWIYALAYVKRVYRRSSGWRVEVVWDVEITEMLGAQPITCDQAPQSVQRTNAATGEALRDWNRKRSNDIEKLPAVFMFESDIRTRTVPGLRRLATDQGLDVEQVRSKADLLDILLSDQEDDLDDE